MKNLLFFCLTLISLLACADKKGEKALLSADCLGYYLTIDGLDYRICNDDKVQSFELDKKYFFSFNYLNECNYLSDKVAASSSVCLLYHPYERDVEIKNVYQ